MCRKGQYLFVRLSAQEEEPPETGGGRVFSLDATSGLLATRRRLGRRGGFFRAALSFCGVSCML